MYLYDASLKAYFYDGFPTKCAGRDCGMWGRLALRDGGPVFCAGHLYWAQVASNASAMFGDEVAQ